MIIFTKLKHKCNRGEHEHNPNTTAFTDYAITSDRPSKQYGA